MKKWILLSCLALVLGGFAFLHISKQNSIYVFSQEKTVETATATPLLFVGDVMLGRYVETLSKKSGDDMYPFGNMQEYLKQHVTIANLEGPIPDAHTLTPINGFSFSFPPSAPRNLKEGGITAVSLANNHMSDKGRNGYAETKRALDAGGIFHFGGYAPTENDYFETKLGTTTVIVYGITMIATGWDEPQAVEVTKKLRSEHPDAYLIAFLHWGDEYVTQNGYQRAFAHSLVDNGVDAIIGSHPHVVQGVELYDDKPIIYSLGNFIFDQYWRNDLEDGVMIRISSLKSSYVYELIPIHSSRSVPSITPSKERGKILSAISRQSEASLQQFLLQGSFAVPK